MWLDRLIRPTPPRADVREVLQAAALLDITEFELFQLAYARWHGRRSDDDELERYFVAYMFKERVPPWVRHFARLIHRLSRDGTLDRRALGVDDLPSSRNMVRRGMRFAVTIATILVALVILAEFAARVLRLEQCMFPPCY